MSHARLADRAAELLGREDAWLRAEAGCYGVRHGDDARRRSLLKLDEVVFLILVDEPGLRPRTGGGWIMRPRLAAKLAPQAGRPGVIEGEKIVPDEHGRLEKKRANLGESPIAWLARRRDAAGRPWLTAAQAAAGEKLREDFYLAGTLGRLTMSWDAAPKGSGGRPGELNPSERALAAKSRVAAALTAAGPELREMLEKICLAGSALEAAERSLGLPRRTGKLVLRRALQRLAEHYGVG